MAILWLLILLVNQDKVLCYDDDYETSGYRDDYLAEPPCDILVCQTWPSQDYKWCLQYLPQICQQKLTVEPSYFSTSLGEPIKNYPIVSRECREYSSCVEKRGHSEIKQALDTKRTQHNSENKRWGENIIDVKRWGERLTPYGKKWFVGNWDRNPKRWSEMMRIPTRKWSDRIKVQPDTKRWSSRVIPSKRWSGMEDFVKQWSERFLTNNKLTNEDEDDDAEIHLRYKRSISELRDNNINIEKIDDGKELDGNVLLDKKWSNRIISIKKNWNEKIRNFMKKWSGRIMPNKKWSNRLLLDKKWSGRIMPDKKWSDRLLLGKKWSGRIMPDKKWSGRIMPDKKWSGRLMPIKKWSGRIMPDKRWSGRIMPDKKWSGRIMPDKKWSGRIMFDKKWSSRIMPDKRWSGRIMPDKRWSGRIMPDKKWSGRIMPDKKWSGRIMHDKKWDDHISPDKKWNNRINFDKKQSHEIILDEQNLDQRMNPFNHKYVPMASKRDSEKPFIDYDNNVKPVNLVTNVRMKQLSEMMFPPDALQRSPSFASQTRSEIESPSNQKTGDRHVINNSELLEIPLDKEHSLQRHEHHRVSWVDEML